MLTLSLGQIPPSPVFGSLHFIRHGGSELFGRSFVCWSTLTWRALHLLFIDLLSTAFNLCLCLKKRLLSYLLRFTYMLLFFRKVSFFTVQTYALEGFFLVVSPMHVKGLGRTMTHSL